jgi:hypothetical protein
MAAAGFRLVQAQVRMAAQKEKGVFPLRQVGRSEHL